jgi:RND family efflux transporter MFP subunit
MRAASRQQYSTLKGRKVGRMPRGHSGRFVFLSLATASTLLVSGCDVNVFNGSGTTAAPANQAASKPAPTTQAGAAQGAAANRPGQATAPAATGARTSAQQSRPEVQVRKGTITDSIKVLGRVVSSQEADLYFKTTGRLRGLFVETGQQVHAGDLLAELETGDLSTRLGKAQADVQNAQIKLEQVKAKAVIDTSGTDQQAVDKAQIDLDQAKLQLEKLRSGTLDADLKAAEASVIQARANVEKARSDLAAKQSDLAAKQADLAAKQAGATPADVAAAQAGVDAARIKLQQAQTGPRPEDVQAAQLAVEKARLKLAQLRDAPPVKPEDVANAQLAVQTAEVNLDAARADASGSPAQKDARVQNAQIALDKARNDLAKLQNTQSSPWDVRLAEQDVSKAENDLAKLTNPLPYDAQTAKAQLDAAQAKLDQLQRGPTDQDLASLNNQIASLQLTVQSAQASVPSAEAALAAAEANYQAKLAGPTEFDTRDAENKVALAQNALEQAKAKLGVTQATIAQSRASSDFDVQTQQKAVEKAQLDLQQLQSNLDDARIIAPYDGKITKVNGKSGDNINAFNPVISISSPAQLLVSAQVQEGDIPKLAVGERALITLDAFPGQILNGTVRDLPSSIVTQQGVVADKTTKMTVDWTRPGADIGMLTRVQIIVQKKDDVLIVPTSAVRTVGKRKFVEYYEGNVKRSRNIEVGISTDVDTEVVSGLDEGMTILAGT